jgi:lysyl endopeptidase
MLRDCLRTWVALLGLLVPLPVLAAPDAAPLHIVKTDLKPLIRAGMRSPVQFAVLVPHTASAASAGRWSAAGGIATWRYAVEVPTAVSLSFHATDSFLPAAATLVVRGTKTTVSYRARDVHRGELWSRVQPGQALEFTLTVPVAERGKLAFNIVSVQAGYRSLGAGVQDHPYYRQLKAAQAGATGTQACVTNYECEVTAANTPLGAATMALVVENQYECTGVLVNDVPQDNTPYVLTARHCETGLLGGGNPGAASSVVAYWDAVTPCTTTPLGSIYDSGTPTQTGAQTMVEQQDAWLLLLDGNPVVSDAQFAGFDASGGAVQGGYTIHHAEGYDKQYTAWFGQAATVNESDVSGSNYLSNFLETVNSVGNIAPGASGSGLINQNNRLVGSLTLGRESNDPSGYGACPTNPPTAPNGSNGIADFTSLAAVWNSTADTSSTTGSTTLKSVLDPHDTGTLAVPSAPVEFVTLNPSTAQGTIGQAITLTWSAPSATGCTAGGGVAGDGWTGSVAASGSLSVTESTANVDTYALSCSYAGGRTAKTSTQVTWLGPAPVVTLTVPNNDTGVWVSTPVTLTWTSNVAPCDLSGGGLSDTNQPASGSVTTTQSTAGDVTYQVTCGDTLQSQTQSLLIEYLTPSLTLMANGTDRLLGQQFFLTWSTNTFAATCTPSGGAPGDGWSNNEFVGTDAVSGQYAPNVTTLGKYTYTLTCTEGSNTVQQSVTVTFENNAPYALASLSATSVAFTDSPADYVTLTWDSNLTECVSQIPSSLTYAPNQTDGYPQGSDTLSPQSSGTFQIQVSCTSGGSPALSASAPVLTLNVTPPPPPTITITFTPSTVLAGQQFAAAWTSTNSNGCQLSGGIPGDPWEMAGAGPSSGDEPELGPAGTYTFGVTCQSIDRNTASATLQKSITVEPLTASLSASPTSLTTGQSFTLTWSSVNATYCTPGGGGADGSFWSGAIGTSGSVTQTASTAGSFTYTVQCGAGSVSATPQNVTIEVAAATGASSTSTSSHSGGGALGWLDLTLLAALASRRRLLVVRR